MIGTVAESSGRGYDAPDRCWRLPPLLSSRYRYGSHTDWTGSSNVSVSTPVLKLSHGFRSSTGGAVSRTIRTDCHHLPVVNWLLAASYSPESTIFIVVPVALPTCRSNISWSLSVSVTLTREPPSMAAPLVMSTRASLEIRWFRPASRMFSGAGSLVKSRSSTQKVRVPRDRSSIVGRMVTRRGACLSSRVMLYDWKRCACEVSSGW